MKKYNTVAHTQEASRPAAGVPGGVRVYRQDHPVHVPGRHLLLHAHPHQAAAGVRHQHREGALLPQQVTAMREMIRISNLHINGHRTVYFLCE